MDNGMVYLHVPGFRLVGKGQGMVSPTNIIGVIKKDLWCKFGLHGIEALRWLIIQLSLIKTTQGSHYSVQRDGVTYKILQCQRFRCNTFLLP